MPLTTAPTVLLTDSQRLKQALMYIIQDSDGEQLAILAQNIMGGEVYFGWEKDEFALEVVLTNLPDDAAGTLRPN